MTKTSQQNEQPILRNAHLTLFQNVLQDIEDRIKVILTNYYWHKQYIVRNDATYYKNFPWKQTLIQQPLEGAATYIG